MKEDFDINSIRLLRHTLGSVDLTDIEEVDPMSSTERREYCGAISAVFPRIEKDIKRFIYEQAISNATEINTWEQAIFGKGTLNGFSLLLEHWRNAHSEHEQNIQENVEK